MRVQEPPQTKLKEAGWRAPETSSGAFSLECFLDAGQTRRIGLKTAETPVLRQWANGLAFALRQLSGRSGQNIYREPTQDKSALFASEGDGVVLDELPWLNAPYRLDPAQVPRFKSLLELYGLLDFYESASRLRLLEVMGVLDWLDRFERVASLFSTLSGQKDFYWLDVGSKNWSYVTAIWAFMNRHQQLAHTPGRPEQPRRLWLDGVELDSARRYRDGHTRADYAQSFIDSLAAWRKDAVLYHSADIRRWQGHRRHYDNGGDFHGYQVITCFLPFVFADPHFAWGLPASRFDPSGVLRRMLALLAENGTLILSNQGEEEARAQAELLGVARKQLAAEGFNLEVSALGELPETFLPSRYERYGFLCRKHTL